MYATHKKNTIYKLVGIVKITCNVYTFVNKFLSNLFMLKSYLTFIQRFLATRILASNFKLSSTVVFKLYNPTTPLCFYNILTAPKFTKKKIIYAYYINLFIRLKKCSDKTLYFNLK